MNVRITCTYLLLAILLGTGPSSLAGVFQVNNSNELQTALQQAQNNGQDDIIRIAQGYYLGNFIYTSHAIENLAVEGGWRSDFSDRVINAENTVLDGNQKGNVFIYSCDKKVNLTIEGITFQNGRISETKGAGVYINNIGYDWDGSNTLEIVNNIIKNNSIAVGSIPPQGVGLYVWTYAKVIFKNNSVFNNPTPGAGQGSGTGGGAYFLVTSKMDIINNSIHDNKGARGGGLYVESRYEQVRILNNRINNNVAMADDGYTVGGYGGGLSAYMYGLNDSTIISGNIFSNNASGGYGGGVFLKAAGEKFIITNNQFTGNTATLSGGGATIWSYTDHLKVIDFINNTIAGNQAGRQGGGIDLWMFYDGITANLYNNIFWENSSDNPGRDLYLDNDYDDNYLPGVCNLYNNDFNQSGWGIYMDIPFPIPSNNLNWKDPLFADQWQGNYMLSKTSPCLNTGENNAPNLPSTDIKGNPRILDGRVDMGAYEGVGVLSAKPVLTPVMMLLIHHD